MNILMVVAQDFRDEELNEPRRALEQARHAVIIASNQVGRRLGVKGTQVDATVTLAQVDTGAFDGVIFVGGPGASVFFDDPHAHRIAVEIDQSGKLLAAICVGPVILAHAGVLTGRRATVFETETRELVDAGAIVTAKGVVEDGHLITASGPTHARAFGERVVIALAAQAGEKEARAN